jgi:hypothetical protein
MEVTMADEYLRPTGIGIVGDVPCETHFWEFCIWATSDPLSEEEIRHCLKDAIPGFDDYFERRSIEIVRGRE